MIAAVVLAVDPAQVCRRTDRVQRLHPVDTHLAALPDGDDPEVLAFLRPLEQVLDQPSVAGLENVQRQQQAGEEDGAQREERDHLRPRLTHDEQGTAAAAPAGGRSSGAD